MEARPICPYCGQTLLARPSGDLICTMHGHAFPARLLGEPAAARARELAAKGRAVGRRCPQDRLAMSAVQGAGASVEACMRCGTVWLPKEEVDRIVATTPASGMSPAEARSSLGLAAVRALFSPTPVRR